MFPFNDDDKNTSFMSPGPTTYDIYLGHINSALGQETPIAFGLHPNAEIGFRTTQSESLLLTLMELQPRDDVSGEGVMSPQQLAEAAVQDIVERFGEKKFDVEDLMHSLEEQGPYQNVLIQEMDVMNLLLAEIMRSLKELSLGMSLRCSKARPDLRN